MAQECLQATLSPEYRRLRETAEAAVLAYSLASTQEPLSWRSFQLTMEELASSIEQLGMTDSKYGRLFTEADARRLMAWAVYRDRQGSNRDLNPIPAVEGRIAEFEADETAPLTFPADEPLFLLRGKDVAAPGAVDEYVRQLQCHDVSHAHLLGANRASFAMREWQAMNPDRVKVPD